jgi:hypothetical protein
MLVEVFHHSRVGIVTPLRDGMNLVAKEYVAAQDPNDPGVLLLSRFAGAAEQMKQALIVNPYDIEEMADAIKVALDMGLQERGAPGAVAGNATRYLLVLPVPHYARERRPASANQPGRLLMTPRAALQEIELPANAAPWQLTLREEAQHDRSTDCAGRRIERSGWRR